MFQILIVRLFKIWHTFIVCVPNEFRLVSAGKCGLPSRITAKIEQTSPSTGPRYPLTTPPTGGQEILLWTLAPIGLITGPQLAFSSLFCYVGRGSYRCGHLRTPGTVVSEVLIPTISLILLIVL